MGAFPMMEQGDYAREPSGRASRVPGGSAAVVIAILSAILTVFVAAPAMRTAERETPHQVSRLAEVATGEIGSALDTLGIRPEQLDVLRKREACRRKLAFVTIASAPGQNGGRIRLRSGGYISPAFEIGPVPVRVALPYPAPYPAGRGTISVLGTDTDAVVALTPPWHVVAGVSAQAREVAWAPSGFCPAAKR